MKKAIAYMRFSSAVQQKGDSLRRQRKLIDDWLVQNPEFTLDTTTYEDLGLSAYKGKHAQSGAFGEFIEAIENGLILPGTVLLVESLDRLSREKIGEATERLKYILKSGVDVITLSDRTHYSEASLDDPYALIKAILISQRANEESELKSSRVKLSWQKKREDAELTGKIMTKACPRWLKVTSDYTQFEVIEAKVRIIQKIFALRKANKSLTAIAKYLNDKSIENLSGKCGEWCPSVIEKLLGNKALIGICRPTYTGRAKGVKEIPEYYPKVLSEEEFYSVQEVRLSPFGFTSHSGNPYLINLLRTVMKCKYCGNTMIITSVSDTIKGYYVCPMRRLHRCSSPAVRREIVDSILIDEILCNLDRLQIETNHQSLQVTLEKKCIELQFQINQFVQALAIAPDVKSLADKIRELDSSLRKNETAIKVLKNKAVFDRDCDVNNLDLSLREDREVCRRLAFKAYKEIKIDTVSLRCDIYFSNGLVFKNFPLSKRCNAKYIISTLKYLDEKTVYF
ncbi:recombinase family protein [Atlantibacter sp.]|uniref:recombinase family protein n=1 Tax=Atlantibacter sp. TaxID=1903473 RepID=UPI00289BA398|nr:recombinase family protein [Atlantibacter sp.]